MPPDPASESPKFRGNGEAGISRSQDLINRLRIQDPTTITRAKKVKQNPIFSEKPSWAENRARRKYKVPFCS